MKTKECSAGRTAGAWWMWVFRNLPRGSCYITNIVDGLLTCGVEGRMVFGDKRKKKYINKLISIVIF